MARHHVVRASLFEHRPYSFTDRHCTSYVIGTGYLKSAIHTKIAPETCSTTKYKRDKHKMMLVGTKPELNGANL